MKPELYGTLMRTSSELISWCNSICILCLVVSIGLGCSRRGTALPAAASANDQRPTEEDSRWNNADYQREKETALAHAEKVREELLRNPVTNEVVLPNPPTGPGMPLPMGVNFYEVAPLYPDYLWCRYDVSENHYDPSNEPQWFESALLQIRDVGPRRFPPLKWIAVVVFNRAEHKGASTFAQCFKVGAVFKSEEVFGLGSDLRELIAKTEMDRHPFKYDSTKRTPAEQQRWLIVEQHAATNAPVTSPTTH
jgi:hypothetical protein